MLNISVFKDLLKSRLVIIPFYNLRSVSLKMDEKMTTIEQAKKLAAYQAVDEHVKDGMVLGIGSGSTIVYAVDRIAEKVKKENLKVICVPTSLQAGMLIGNHGLMLRTLNEYPELHCVIDGADEVDSSLTLIKGGGACHTQEKIIAYNSKKVVIIADYTKDSKCLGDKYRKGIPIEIIPVAYVSIQKKITSILGGLTELRMGKMKAGPVLTDNANYVIDWKFPDNISDWDQVNKQIKMIPGVVETGLFVNMVDAVYFGQEDGTVKKINK